MAEMRHDSAAGQPRVTPQGGGDESSHPRRPAQDRRTCTRCPRPSGPTCACRRTSTPTMTLWRRPWKTARWSSWSTRPPCPASSARPWPCPTSTRVTASPSAASWRPALPDGVVSPGGVGYDINCGVRAAGHRARRRAMCARICAAVGRCALPAPAQRRRRQGAPAHQQGGAGRDPGRRQPVGRDARATPAREDVAHTEEGGRMAGADPAKVSKSAKERGLEQVGTLGSGNHFAEIDVVTEIHRRRGGRRLWAAPGPGRGADPLRQPRAGPPGRHRLHPDVPAGQQALRLSSCPTASSSARRWTRRKGRTIWRP